MTDRSIILIDGLKTIFNTQYKIFFRDDVIIQLSKYFELEYDIWLNFGSPEEEELWNCSTVPDWLRSKIITTNGDYDQIKSIQKSQASFSVGITEIPATICGPYYDRSKIFGTPDLALDPNKLNEILNSKIIIYLGSVIPFVKKIGNTIDVLVIGVSKNECLKYNEPKNENLSGVIVLPESNLSSEEIIKSVNTYLSNSKFKIFERSRNILCVTDGKQISGNLPIFHWSI